MKLTVLFFATLKDRAGTRQTELTMPDGTTIAGLKDVLSTQFPNLAPALPSCIASRNHEFANNDETLADGDEVAFFPPVSGGALSVSNL